MDYGCIDGLSATASRDDAIAALQEWLAPYIRMTEEKRLERTARLEGYRTARVNYFKKPIWVRIFCEKPEAPFFGFNYFSYCKQESYIDSALTLIKASTNEIIVVKIHDHQSALIAQIIQDYQVAKEKENKHD